MLPRAPEVMEKLRIVIFVALAAFMAIGIILIILSSVLYDAYMQLLGLAFLLLIPLPTFIARQLSDGDGFGFADSDDTSSGLEVGTFISSSLLASGLALPLTLFHAQLIEIVPMLMSVGGGILIYSSIVVYQSFYHTEAEF